MPARSSPSRSPISGSSAPTTRTSRPPRRPSAASSCAPMPRRPSNYRAVGTLDRWLKRHNIPGISGIDTRKLTARIREIGHAARRDRARHGRGLRHRTRCVKQAKSFPGLEGLDLAKDVSCRQTFTWNETPWRWNDGLRPSDRADLARGRRGLMASSGTSCACSRARAPISPCCPRNRPPTTCCAIARTACCLSNGPGDPAATGAIRDPDDPWTDR